MGMDAKREWKFDNQVSQAAGMVSVQAECTVDEALLKLSEFASPSFRMRLPAHWSCAREVLTFLPAVRSARTW